MKKIIYILLFAFATSISISSVTKANTKAIAEVSSPIGGFALDPK